MTRIRGVQDVPALCELLQRDNFYGEIRLCFRAGKLERIVTEQSQLVNPTQERNSNADATK